MRSAQHRKPEPHADHHHDQNRALHDHPQQHDHRKQQPHGSGQRIDRRGSVGGRRRASGRLRRSGRTERDRRTTRPTACSAFEYPNPFNTEALAKGKYRFYPDTLFFQLAGNRVSSNMFCQERLQHPLAGPFTGDVTLCGGFSEFFNSLGIPYPQSHSVNNCASGNLLQRRDLPCKNRGNLGLPEQNDPEPGRWRAGRRIPRRAAGGSRRDQGSGAAGRTAGTTAAADHAEPVRRSAQEPAVLVTR